jgi:hypothetical protein
MGLFVTWRILRLQGSHLRVEGLIGEVSETFHVHAATVCAVSCVDARVSATAGVSWTPGGV